MYITELHYISFCYFIQHKQDSNVQLYNNIVIFFNIKKLCLYSNEIVYETYYLQDFLRKNNTF